jgi:tetratricopeptide (TPR) repeat protein
MTSKSKYINRKKIPQILLTPMIFDKNITTEKEYKEEEKRIISCFREYKERTYVYEENELYYIYNFGSSNQNRNQRVIKKLLKLDTCEQYLNEKGAYEIICHYNDYHWEQVRSFQFDRALKTLIHQYWVMEKYKVNMELSARLTIYHDIIKVFIHLNRIEDILAVAPHALKIVREIKKYDQGIDIVYISIAQAMYYNGAKSQALELLKEGLKHATLLKSKDFVGFNLMINAFSKPNFDVESIWKNLDEFRAFYMLCKTNKIRIESLTHITQAIIYDELFHEYFRQSKYQKALEYGDKAFNILSKTNSYYRRLGILILHMSIASSKSNDEKMFSKYTRAIENHNGSLEIIPSIFLCPCGVLFPKHACAKCNIKKYCSRECQKEDWQNHRNKCID